MLLFHGLGIEALCGFDRLVGLLGQLVRACAEIVQPHAYGSDGSEDDAPRCRLREKVESGVCGFRLFYLPGHCVEGDFEREGCRA